MSVKKDPVDRLSSLSIQCRLIFLLYIICTVYTESQKATDMCVLFLAAMTSSRSIEIGVKNFTKTPA